MPRNLAVFAVAVALFSLSACGSDPMPNANTYYEDDLAIVFYPADWHEYRVAGATLFSPSERSPENDSSNVPYVGVMAWTGALRNLGKEHFDPEAFIDWMVEDWRLTGLGRVQQIKIGALPGYKLSFDLGESGEAKGRRGWIAASTGNGKHIAVFALARPVGWKTHEPVFEAILSRIECE